MVNRFANKVTALVAIGAAGVLSASVGVAIAGPAAHHAPAASGSRHAPAVSSSRGPRGRRGPRGYPGPVGPKGDTGPAGPKGDTGPAGGGFDASNIDLVRGQVSVASSDHGSTYAKCPSGEVALGGGVGWDGGAQGNALYVQDSGPVGASNFFSSTTTGTTPVQWYGSFKNLSGSAATAYVWVICA